MIDYFEEKPSLDEYKELMNSVGFSLKKRGVSDFAAQVSLDASPLCVLARDSGRAVGMVRLSGDLSMYAYIQDTIVLPEYHGNGVGKRMMEIIFEKIKSEMERQGSQGLYLGVCATPGSEVFYEKLDFKGIRSKFMSLNF